MERNKNKKRNPYWEKNRLDPRVTFAFVAYMSTFSIYFREVLPLFLICLVAILTAIGMKINMLSVARRLKRLIKMVLMVSILQGIFNPSGTILFEILGISIITTGGLLIGVSIFLRLTILIIGGIMLSSYPNRVLIQGMIQLKIPYELAFMVSVGMRFIPMSRESFEDSLIAIQLRGIDFDKLSWKERIQIYTYLLLPTVANGIVNARGLAMAMELRGFRLYDARTSFITLEIKRKDYLALCMVFILFVGTIVGNIYFL